MGICPVCGTFIDPGEPYCPDCGYIVGSDCDDMDTITIDSSEYYVDDVEEVLRRYGYDLDDLRLDLIDDDDLEDILDELNPI